MSSFRDEWIAEQQVFDEHRQRLEWERERIDRELTLLVVAEPSPQMDLDLGEDNGTLRD